MMSVTPVFVAPRASASRRCSTLLHYLLLGCPIGACVKWGAKAISSTLNPPGPFADDLVSRMVRITRPAMVLAVTTQAMRGGVDRR